MGQYELPNGVIIRQTPAAHEWGWWLSWPNQGRTEYAHTNGSRHHKSPHIAIDAARRVNLHLLDVREVEIVDALTDTRDGLLFRIAFSDGTNLYRPARTTIWYANGPDHISIDDKAYPSHTTAAKEALEINNLQELLDKFNKPKPEPAKDNMKTVTIKCRGTNGFGDYRFDFSDGSHIQSDNHLAGAHGYTNWHAYSVNGTDVNYGCIRDTPHSAATLLDIYNFDELLRQYEEAQNPKPGPVKEKPPLRITGSNTNEYGACQYILSDATSIRSWNRIDAGNTNWYAYDKYGWSIDPGNGEQAKQPNAVLAAQLLGINNFDELLKRYVDEQRIATPPRKEETKPPLTVVQINPTDARPRYIFSDHYQIHYWDNGDFAYAIQRPHFFDGYEKTRFSSAISAASSISEEHGRVLTEYDAKFPFTIKPTPPRKEKEVQSPPLTAQRDDLNGFIFSDGVKIYATGEGFYGRLPSSAIITLTYSDVIEAAFQISANHARALKTLLTREREYASALDAAKRVSANHAHALQAALSNEPDSMKENTPQNRNALQEMSTQANAEAVIDAFCRLFGDDTQLFGRLTRHSQQVWYVSGTVNGKPFTASQPTLKTALINYLQSDEMQQKIQQPQPTSELPTMNQAKATIDAFIRLCGEDEKPFRNNLTWYEDSGSWCVSGQRKGLGFTASHRTLKAALLNYLQSDEGQLKTQQPLTKVKEVETVTTHPMAEQMAAATHQRNRQQEEMVQQQEEKVGTLYEPLKPVINNHSMKLPQGRLNLTVFTFNIEPYKALDALHFIEGYVKAGSTRDLHLMFSTDNSVIVVLAQTHFNDVQTGHNFTVPVIFDLLRAIKIIPCDTFDDIVFFAKAEFRRAKTQIPASDME